MSSELLRRAAKVMRAEAEAADTGEVWESAKVYDSRYRVLLKPSDLELDYLGGAWEEPAWISVGHAQADHIAAWHPAVALAVADWLGFVADFIDASSIGMAGSNYDYALTVARAYLGEPS